jgi:hypothetical protein
MVVLLGAHLYEPEYILELRSEAAPWSQSFLNYQLQKPGGFFGAEAAMNFSYSAFARETISSRFIGAPLSQKLAQKAIRIGLRKRLSGPSSRRNVLRRTREKNQRRVGVILLHEEVQPNSIAVRHIHVADNEIVVRLDEFNGSHHPGRHIGDLNLRENFGNGESQHYPNVFNVINDQNSLLDA